jgi:hypothetical protein
MEIVKRVKEFLLRPFLPGEELDVIDKEDMGGPVFVAKVVLCAVGDGGEEIVRELLAGGVDNASMSVSAAVGDGTEEVSLAQSSVTVDEQGVVHLGRLVGCGQGGGCRQAVTVSDDEAVEGEPGV